MARKPMHVSGKLAIVRLSSTVGYRRGDSFQGCPIVEVFSQELVIDVPLRQPKFGIASELELLPGETKFFNLAWQDYDAVMPAPKFSCQINSVEQSETAEISGHQLKVRVTKPGRHVVTLLATDTDGYVHPQEVLIKSKFKVPMFEAPPTIELTVGTPTSLDLAITADLGDAISVVCGAGQGDGLAEVKVLSKGQGWQLEVTATQAGYLEFPIIVSGLDGSTSKLLCLRLFPALPALSFEPVRLEVGQKRAIWVEKPSLLLGLTVTCQSLHPELVTAGWENNLLEVTPHKPGQATVKLTLSTLVSTTSYQVPIWIQDSAEVETADADPWSLPAQVGD